MSFGERKREKEEREGKSDTAARENAKAGSCATLLRKKVGVKAVRGKKGGITRGAGEVGVKRGAVQVVRRGRKVFSSHVFTIEGEKLNLLV